MHLSITELQQTLGQAQDAPLCSLSTAGTAILTSAAIAEPSRGKGFPNAPWQIDTCAVSLFKPGTFASPSVEPYAACVHVLVHSQDAPRLGAHFACSLPQ
jgi:hypothetical protein